MMNQSTPHLKIILMTPQLNQNPNYVNLEIQVDHQHHQHHHQHHHRHHHHHQHHRQSLKRNIIDLPV
jgi:G3E family GTPase